MDGMDGMTREKLLSKLMDFLSMLPDADDSKEGHEMGDEKCLDDKVSGDPKAKVEMLAIDAKPTDKLKVV